MVKENSNSPLRDYLDVADINNEGKSFKVSQVIDKNEHLMTDDVLGRRRVINKNHSPLDPHYLISTVSNRKMLLG
jgi:hypothetical protein